MKDFVEGLILAMGDGIITRKLVKVYIKGYIAEQFGIEFSDAQLDKIEKS